MDNFQIFLGHYYCNIVAFNYMPTGKQIKRLRGNISASRAASLIGIDAERLRKWEQRDSDPSDTADIKAIEDYFGCPISQLEHLDNFQFGPNPKKTEATKDTSTIEALINKISSLERELSQKNTQVQNISEVRSSLAQMDERMLVMARIQKAQMEILLLLSHSPGLKVGHNTVSEILDRYELTGIFGSKGTGHK